MAQSPGLQKASYLLLHAEMSYCVSEGETLELSVDYNMSSLRSVCVCVCVMENACHGGYHSSKCSITDAVPDCAKTLLSIN